MIIRSHVQEKRKTNLQKLKQCTMNTIFKREK